MAEVFSHVVSLVAFVALFKLYDVDCRGIGQPKGSILLPSIIWDPRNPLFNCPKKGGGINTIYARVNDYVYFSCPIEGRNFEWDSLVSRSYVNMYENGWLLTDRDAALKCDASAKAGAPLVYCNDPKKVNPRTVRFTRHPEVPGDPSFNYGTTYYIIGTGTGKKTNVTQKKGGRCSGYTDGTEIVYKLILRIHVCSREDQNTDKCPICLDSTCYRKGCTEDNSSMINSTESCSQWTSYFFQNATNGCFSVSYQNCTVGSIQKYSTTNWKTVKVACPPIEPTKKPTTNKTGCTPWVNKTDIYRTEKNVCIRMRYRNCVIGTLESHQITEWSEVESECPILTQSTKPPPQSTVIVSNNCTTSRPSSERSTTASNTTSRPSTGRSSTGSNKIIAKSKAVKGRSVITTYVIPIAAAVVGALVGIVVSVCYMRRRNRNAARTHSTDSSETESDSSAEKNARNGHTNHSFEMQGIKKQPPRPLKEKP